MKEDTKGKEIVVGIKRVASRIYHVPAFPFHADLSDILVDVHIYISVYKLVACTRKCIHIARIYYYVHSKCALHTSLAQYEIQSNA